MKLVKLTAVLFLLALAPTALKAQSVTLTSHNNADQLAGDVDTFTWSELSDEYWVEIGSAIGLKD